MRRPPRERGSRPITDKLVVRIVVASLAIAVLGAVIGAIYLESVGRQTPALVSDVAKIALGAIAALLARTSVDPGQLEAERPSVAEVSPAPFDQDAL